MPKVRVPWSVPKDLWERPTAFAREKGVSRSRVVERALEEYFLYYPEVGLAKEPPERLVFPSKEEGEIAAW